jgi:hypothetical protein
MDKIKQKIGTIDVEPTWESLCISSYKHGLTAEVLMPACKIADAVRQAQKKGAKSITFKFGKDNLISLEVEE